MRRGRIEEHLDGPDPRAIVLAVIEKLLPLDAERRAEMEANVALIAEAPVMSASRRSWMWPMQRSGTPVATWSPNLHRARLTAPGLDVEGATTLLHELVDGLAIHMLVNPDPAFERQALRIIETTIDGLWPPQLRNRDSFSRTSLACRKNGNEAR